MSTKIVKALEAKVRPRFYTSTKTKEKASKSTLFAGLELEVEFNPYSTWRQREFLLSEISAQWWYSKYDSTIIDGIEFITHPATFAWYKKNYNEIAWRLDMIKVMGCEASSRCGIHIHMNKSAFTENQFLNFQKLIYDYPDFTLKFSGRSKNDLDKWASIYYETDDDLKYKAKTKKSPPDLRERIGIVRNRKWTSTYRNDKFVAVNVLKKNTNEIRIFSSSLNPYTIFKYLEFCFAAFEYSGAFKIVTIEGFMRWCKLHKSQYPNLVNSLKKHRYIV